ncbi:MAG: hypothetical protein JXB85_13240 [Anaerolineales bacterium]|nr:hypothetical protein [Anaerolineales bacterium]
MKLVKGLKIAALVILGLMVIAWLFFARVIFITIPGGTIHPLVALVVVGLLAYLGWKRPLLGGLGLTLVGVCVAMYYLLILYSLEQALPALLLLCTPMVISGLVFIEADWMTRKANEAF